MSRVWTIRRLKPGLVAMEGRGEIPSSDRAIVLAERDLEALRDAMSAFLGAAGNQTRDREINSSQPKPLPNAIPTE